jgi:hypothetical protein
MKLINGLQKINNQKYYLINLKNIDFQMLERLRIYLEEA